jgi:hypothetical protein
MVVASIFSIPLEDIMTTLLKARKENGKLRISQNNTKCNDYGHA